MVFNIYQSIIFIVNNNMILISANYHEKYSHKWNPLVTAHMHDKPGTVQMENIPRWANL